MSNVIEVKFRKASQRGVYCQPLKLYFPPLYRVVSSATEEDLSVFQTAMEIAPFENCIGYSIDPDEDIFGLQERKIVNHILEDTGSSVVIRHHRSQQSASEYLEGAHDAGIPHEHTGSIIQTDDGYFSFMQRPTRSHWRGPTVFYGAWYFTDKNPFGSDYWEMRIDNLGETTVGEYLTSDPE